MSQAELEIVEQLRAPYKISHLTLFQRMQTVFDRILSDEDGMEDVFKKVAAIMLKKLDEFDHTFNPYWTKEISDSYRWRIKGKMRSYGIN